MTERTEPDNDRSLSGVEAENEEERTLANQPISDWWISTTGFGDLPRFGEEVLGADF